MANPVLNEKAFERAAGGSAGAARPAVSAAAPGYPLARDDMARDGMARDGMVMTVRGTLSATGVLFAMLTFGAIAGWLLVKTATDPQTGERVVTSFPTWIILAVLVGFGLVMAATWRPRLASIVGPVYGVVEGVVVGAVSHAYESQFDGIVLQALGATVAVFGVMLFLYATRTIRVTQRFRAVVVAATLGLMVFYGISLLARLFGAQVPFITSSSGFGIAFSVFAAGLAAFNLLLDFDLVERGVRERAPAYMEWFAALGLMVTIVWLYLELLRLLAKLRE